VSPPERRGFGSTVIASMAKATIGASPLDYAPSGVVWRLTCPAANGLEEARRKSATRDAFSFVPVTGLTSAGLERVVALAHWRPVAQGEPLSWALPSPEQKDGVNARGHREKGYVRYIHSTLMFPRCGRAP